MSKEAIPETLGAHVGMSTPTAELWYDVAHGQLSVDEGAARLLAREDVEAGEREAIDEAKAVFAPHPVEHQQGQLETLLARQQTEQEAVVVPLRPRRARRWIAGLVGVAAAAVLMVWLVPSQPADDRGAFLGGYEVELDNAAAAMRGGPEAGLPTFLLGDEVRVRLVPEKAIEGPVEVAVFAWDRSGPAHRVEVEPRVHERGVVELVTTVQALGLGEGEWELVFAIGWAQALPVSWEELVDERAPGPEGYEVVRKRVRIAARP
jgi:hypothetical protein